MRVVPDSIDTFLNVITEAVETLTALNAPIPPRLQEFLLSRKKQRMTIVEFKALRQQMRLTQESLAEYLEVTAVYISYLENGKRPITGSIAEKMRKLEQTNIREFKLKEAS